MQLVSTKSANVLPQISRATVVSQAVEKLNLRCALRAAWTTCRFAVLMFVRMDDHTDRLSTGLARKLMVKTEVPVATMIAAPGTGKSTLADMLPAAAAAQLLAVDGANAAFRTAVSQHYEVNISMANGSRLSVAEENLCNDRGADACLAIRVLWHSFFRATRANEDYATFFTHCASIAPFSFKNVVECIGLAKGCQPFLLTVVLDEAHLLVDPSRRSSSDGVVTAAGGARCAVVRLHVFVFRVTSCSLSRCVGGAWHSGLLPWRMS